MNVQPQQASFSFFPPLALGRATNSQPSRPALVLVELLVAVCVLLVLLGLLVGISDHARSSSAEAATSDLLSRIHPLLSSSVSSPSGQPMPLPADLFAPPSAALLDQRPLLFQKNAKLVQFLSVMPLPPPAGTPSHASPLLPVFSITSLPPSMYDGQYLRDAWGTPLMLLSGQEPSLGFSTSGMPYLVSAGPDRSFLSHEDNLYSYEYSHTLKPASSTLPQPPNSPR